jgi:DNA polymerase eta
VEDGVLENRRRPKVITMHYRTAQSRSRQIPIPGSNAIDENLLYDLANTLLRQVVADGQAWPCSNLSLSVSSFEDGVSNNKAIESFLIRGDQAKALTHSSRHRDADNPPSEQAQTEKRRKLDGEGGGNGIKSFFANPSHLEDTATDEPDRPEEPVEKDPELSGIPRFVCPRCSKSMFEYEKEEHDDWHFAKDLASQDREEAMASHPPPPTKSSARGATARGRGGRGGGSRGKPEKGQMRLAFQ